MVNEPVKIAVIGIGAFGALHARTLNFLPEAQLVAVVNRTRSKAEQLARELGVPHVFGTVEELIGHEIAEALVIGTNTETHVEMAEAALAAGIHVLVEKPVAGNLADAQRLEAVSKKTKSVAMAGHICMFHSLVSPLIERVRHEGLRSAHFVRHRSARPQSSTAPIRQASGSESGERGGFPRRGAS